MSDREQEQREQRQREQREQREQRAQREQTEQREHASVDALKGTESERRTQAPIDDKNRELGRVMPVEPISTAIPDDVQREADEAAAKAHEEVVARWRDKFALSDDALFEVMVDSWGHDPAYTRGTLVRAGDVPYDILHALNMGSIRHAPEYEGSAVPHATMPLEPGTGGARIDVDVQRNVSQG